MVVTWRYWRGGDVCGEVACARGGDVARSCFLAAAEPYTLTINIKTILKM